MENKLMLCKEKLKKFNQEHLLEFYNELNHKEKERLLDEILGLDIEKILYLYDNSKKKQKCEYKISELIHYERDLLKEKEINKYTKLGERQVKNGKCAIVTMAGGQGTRLGYKGPKGTYEIKFSNGEKLSLFEIMCNNIKKTNKKYNIILPWYIMVSVDNKDKTIEYFKMKNYFGYNKNMIKFFVQDTIPLIDIEGKIVLQEYGKIKMVSNGNGNVFKSMKNSNIIKEMKRNHIKWVSFAGIDNVLIENIDELFLGMIIAYKKKIGSKSIFKEQALEKTAVYCKKDGRPAILDYDEISEELSNQKDLEGKYLYREANMLSHVMSIDAIEKSSKIELPYHRAYKKNPIINEEGTKIVPTTPNTFKFENFIFDSFMYFDDMILLRVDKEKEFAPIKDFNGIYTPETAKEAYERKYKEYGKHNI